MAEIAFAIPGDILTPTGGYAYDRQVLRRLADHDIKARHLQLPGSFPSPTPEDIEETSRLIDALPPETIVLIDGLAFGALPKEAADRIDRKLIALVHHPLGLEHGLSPERAAYLVENEKAVLKCAIAVIVTSHATGRLLAADLDVPAADIHVAEPGTDASNRATGCRAPLRLLAVGSIVPRKAYDVLVEALSGLLHEEWQLTIVGADDRAPDYAAKIRRDIDARGLHERITLTGAVPDSVLVQHYAKADIFVMASHFEGFGMVLTEALARGLPIVTTTGGAANETVSDAVALKVPPGDPVALRTALARLILDPHQRQALSDAAWAKAQTLARWDDTARIIARVLKENGA